MIFTYFTIYFIYLGAILRRPKRTIENLLLQSKAISKKQQLQNEDIKSEEYVYFEEDDFEPELDFPHFYCDDSDETYCTDSESVNKIETAESVKDCDADNLQGQSDTFRFLDSESKSRVSLKQDIVDSCLLRSRNEISTYQVDALTSDDNEYGKMDVDCN